MPINGVVRCALAAVLFGATAPLAAELADDVSAFTLAGLLYLGAAVAVAPFVASSLPSAASVRRGGGRLAAAVVFGGAIGPVLLAVGLRHATPSTSSLLLNLELVFTTVIAGFVFREHIGPRIASGTALVVAASALLAGGGGDVRVGALLIGLACVFWAIDNCVTAGLDELSAGSITLAKGLLAGGVNLAIGLIIGGTPSAEIVVAALAIGALGYGASITLWVAGARDLGAARGQLVFATAPFVGALVAWTVLGDDVTGRSVAALAIAAAGVSLVARSGHLHEHQHQAIVHDHEHDHADGHHTHVHAHRFTGRHRHAHEHAELVHAHPHVPDLHHKHAH